MPCRLEPLYKLWPVSEIETGNFHEMSSVWFFIWDTALLNKNCPHKMIKGYEAFIMQSNYHKNIKFKAISYTFSSNS